MKRVSTYADWVDLSLNRPEKNTRTLGSKEVQERNIPSEIFFTQLDYVNTFPTTHAVISQRPERSRVFVGGYCKNPRYKSNICTGTQCRIPSSRLKGPTNIILFDSSTRALKVTGSVSANVARFFLQCNV